MGRRKNPPGLIDPGCINNTYKSAAESGGSLTTHLALDLHNTSNKICHTIVSYHYWNIPVMSSSKKSSDDKPWQDRRSGRGRGDLGGTRGISQSFGRPVRGSPWKGTPEQSSSPEPARGALLSTLSQANLTEAAVKYKPNSCITDCETVASYNWLDRVKPTIAVPGKPLLSTKPCSTDASRKTCKVDTTG